jgi:hypothetical protein
LFGNGYNYDSYISGKALGYLDKDDPIIKKAYKGNSLSPKQIANSIDSAAVGEYANDKEYTPGTWYNKA